MKKIGVKKEVQMGIGGKKKSKVMTILSGSLWKIFNIPLFSRDVNQVLNIIGSNLELGTRKFWIATVNPEFIMEANKDKEFRQILKKTSLNVMDGIGLVWAKEIDNQFVSLSDVSFLKKFFFGIKTGVEILRGEHRDQVASGADLMLNLGEMAMKNNSKIFFLGGFGDRAKKTAKLFKRKFFLKDKQVEVCEGEPNINNKEVIKKINKFRPDILLVAYGMKKQEFWINRNLKDLDVGIVMGVGRSFDYYSGELKRAPKKWQKMGLEWLYSLIKEPKRWKRQLVLPKFVWKVLVK